MMERLWIEGENRIETTKKDLVLLLTPFDGFGVVYDEEGAAHYSWRYRNFSILPLAGQGFHFL